MNNEMVEREAFYNANFKLESTFVLKYFCLLFYRVIKPFCVNFKCIKYNNESFTNIKSI